MCSGEVLIPAVPHGALLNHNPLLSLLLVGICQFLYFSTVWNELRSNKQHFLSPYVLLEFSKESLFVWLFFCTLCIIGDRLWNTIPCTSTSASGFHLPFTVSSLQCALNGCTRHHSHEGPLIPSLGAYWYNGWWCQLQLITSCSLVLLSPWKLKLQTSLINHTGLEIEDNKA